MASDTEQLPICIIVLGMAGSGKTSLVQRISADLHLRNEIPYVLNLDPACLEVPYPANIDIRDTVKYKEVMKQYGLGPNGGIITSLNLFATRFDQVMNIIKSKKGKHKYILIDTPGQIEVFTWSASGTIITETLASEFPTIVVFVMDIVKAVSPVTFMSNMLYACSILYKTKLPFMLVMNKVDIIDARFAVDWMQDFESFLAALEQDQSYSSNLARSLSLVLDVFYKDLKSVGFSAANGTGRERFFNLVDECVREYDNEYRVEYLRLKNEVQQRTSKQTDKEAGASSSSSLTDQVTSEKEPLIEFGGNSLLSDLPESILVTRKDDDVVIDEDDEQEDEEEKQEYQQFKKEFLTKLK